MLSFARMRKKTKTVMGLHLETFSLFLCILCTCSSTATEEYQLCTIHENDMDGLSCSASLDLLPACLVCPISRDRQTGLSWKRSNETLFIGAVRLSGDENTYTVNKCGPDNYTLSVLPTDLDKGGYYTCNSRNSTLAAFDLIIKDTTLVKLNGKLCVADFNGNRDTPCKVVLHSSPACLVRPVNRERSNNLSWKYSNNITLFRGEVRIGKQLNTSVNKCYHENYSLSLLPNNVSDGGYLTCNQGEATLARFNVIVMELISQMYLRCQNESGHCKFELHYNSTMFFECLFKKPQSSFTLSWFVDERLISSDHQDINRSSFPSNITSILRHTFIGTERSLSCQVNGDHVISTNRTLFFSRITRVTPVLVLFWNDLMLLRTQPIEINRTTTIEARCEVSNVKFPVKLSWEVDNEEKWSKEITSWTETLYNSGTRNLNGTNGTTDAFYNLSNEVYIIEFNFTPTKYSHTLGCVCKGPLVFGRKVSVVFFMEQLTKKDPSYSLMIWIVVSFPVVSLVIFCVVSMKKVVFSKKTIASSSGNSERNTETPPSQHGYRPEEIYLAEKTPDYDIYYGNDNSDSLSNFVRLINRISENGRLERWIGELSGMVYDKNYCVASTYRDDASEVDISEFRTLAMHVKDVVDHDNLVDIIGIEISKEPFYIYTEHIEGGNLRTFLNDLQSTMVDPSNYLGELLRFSKEVSSALVYLKSAKLSHPAICCEKVLLTEEGTCKVYDFQSYPVPENVVFYIVLKHEQSFSNWKLAPETRMNKKHSYRSDSWSLSAFICEVYSLGTDPCKAERNSLYGVPANYYDVSFRRPHLCPDSIYSTLKSGWNIAEKERPNIETIYKSLTAVT